LARAWRRRIPQFAVLEDSADVLALAGLDTGDDFHGPTAFGAHSLLLIDRLRNSDRRLRRLKDWTNRPRILQWHLTELDSHRLVVPRGGGCPSNCGTLIPRAGRGGGIYGWEAIELRGLKRAGIVSRRMSFEGRGWRRGHGGGRPERVTGSGRGSWRAFDGGRPGYGRRRRVGQIGPGG